jgi:hypothetical protein
VSASDDARRELSAALGAVCASAAYLVTTAGRVGLVYYLPTERRWTLVAPTGVIAMDWFARAAWTLVALGVGLAFGWRLGTTSRERWTRGLWQVAWLLLAWSALFTTMWLLRG